MPITQIDPSLTTPDFGRLATVLQAVIAPEAWKRKQQQAYFRQNPSQAQQLARAARRQIAGGASRQDAIAGFGQTTGALPDVIEGLLSLHPLSAAEEADTLAVLGGLPQKELDERFGQLGASAEERKAFMAGGGPAAKGAGAALAAQQELERRTAFQAGAGPALEGTVATEELLTRGTRAGFERRRLEAQGLLDIPELEAEARLQSLRDQAATHRQRNQAGAAVFEARRPGQQFELTQQDIERGQIQMDTYAADFALDRRMQGLQEESLGLSNDLQALRLEAALTGEAPTLDATTFAAGNTALRDRQSAANLSYRQVLKGVSTSPDFEKIIAEPDESSAEELLMNLNIEELQRQVAGKKVKNESVVLARSHYTDRFIAQRQLLTSVNLGKYVTADANLVPLDHLTDEQLLFLDPTQLVAALQFGSVVLISDEVERLRTLALKNNVTSIFQEFLMMWDSMPKGGG